MPVHPALNDVGRVVGGAVVDDEDLGVPVALGDAGEDALEGVLNPRTLVVRGNDDAEAGKAHVRLVCRRWAKSAMQRRLQNPMHRRIYDTSFLQRRMGIEAVGDRLRG